MVGVTCALLKVNTKDSQITNNTCDVEGDGVGGTPLMLTTSGAVRCRLRQCRHMAAHVVALTYIVGVADTGHVQEHCAEESNPNPAPAQTRGPVS